MLRLYIDESYLFTEAIADIKKYYPNIDNDTFMQLIELDPTYRQGSNSAGKYGKWILNLYNKGRLSEDDINSITDVLNQFTIYRNRIQNKDLNSYKSLSDLEDILATVVDDDSMLTDRQKLRFLKNVKAGRTKISAEDDYEIALETPKFIVYIPHTHEASMKLGKGTSWCTAHENPDWYNHYTEDDGKLYIIQNKKTGERWQFSDDTYDFLDETDNDFNVIGLLAQDKQLADFFSQFGFEGMEHFNEDGYYVYTGTNIPDNIKEHISNVLIDYGVTYIPEKTFMNCDALKEVIIPDTVKLIGSMAFRGCTFLESVTIPGSVRNIESDAFSFCEYLKTVTFSEGLQNISTDAFYGCERLKDIVIPSSVKHIGMRAFGECVSLKLLTILEGVDEIDAHAFSGCISLRIVDIPNSVTFIGSDAFSHCGDLVSITLPNNIETIEESTFEYCASLPSIEIPESVTSINNYAFTGCESLKSVVIPNGVTHIGIGAFSDCDNLESLTIPDTVDWIEDKAFAWCNNLIVYTNNKLVIEYCNDNDVPVKPLTKNEFYKKI